MLSRENNYVYLGRAKRNSEVHAKMMKSMKGEDEEAQLVCWVKKATGEMLLGWLLMKVKTCLMIMGLQVEVRIILLKIWQGV